MGLFTRGVMFRLQTISRARFILAVLAVYAAGAALLWAVSNLHIDLSVPLALGYLGGQEMAVWWVISVPLIWLCRARARTVGVRLGGVLVVWAVSTALHLLYLASLWNMGRSWRHSSDAVLLAVSSTAVAGILLWVGLLCWLAFKRPAAIAWRGGA